MEIVNNRNKPNMKYKFKITYWGIYGPNEDFEKETSIEDMFDDDYDIFEPSAEDLKEWQMASCGLV